MLVTATIGMTIGELGPINLELRSNLPQAIDSTPKPQRVAIKQLFAGREAKPLNFSQQTWRSNQECVRRTPRDPRNMLKYVRQLLLSGIKLMLVTATIGMTIGELGPINLEQ